MTAAPVDLSVYLVTDTAQCAARGRSVAETVALAVAGGVTAVQIREKHAAGRSSSVRFWRWPPSSPNE